MLASALARQLAHTVDMTTTTMTTMTTVRLPFAPTATTPTILMRVHLMATMARAGLAAASSLVQVRGTTGDGAMVMTGGGDTATAGAMATGVVMAITAGMDTAKDTEADTDTGVDT